MSGIQACQLPGLVADLGAIQYSGISMVAVAPPAAAVAVAAPV